MNKKIIFAVIISILFFSFYLWVDARAGWWGGSGWSGSSKGEWIAAVVAGLYFAIYKIRRMKMIKKAKIDLENALKEDSSWDIKNLDKVVWEVFYKYQKAWSEKDISTLEPYMTKKYYKKSNRILNTQLKLSGRINILEKIQLHSLELMSVRDNPGKDGDMFAMEVTASMIDYTIDEFDGRFVTSTLPRNDKESQSSYERRAMTQPHEFKEYYIFIRHNGKWLLNNVKQKFSIIWDIIWLSPTVLKWILAYERSTDNVNDDMLYTD